MKSIQEMIATMQAFADGKKIECRFIGSENNEWEPSEHPLWDWHSTDYRIKLEPKINIVPYETPEEFLAAMKEHGFYVSQVGGYFDMPLRITMDGISLPSLRLDGKIEFRFHGYENLVSHTWVDGTPCGKEVTE